MAALFYALASGAKRPVFGQFSNLTPLRSFPPFWIFWARKKASPPGIRGLLSLFTDSSPCVVSLVSDLSKRIRIWSRGSLPLPFLFPAFFSGATLRVPMNISDIAADARAFRLMPLPCAFRFAFRAALLSSFARDSIKASGSPGVFLRVPTPFSLQPSF